MGGSIFTSITGDRLQRLGFESFWILIGQTLAALGGIVGVRMLTGVLNPTVYGQLALVMTLVALVQTTLLAPLGATFARFFSPSRELQQLPGFIRGSKRFLGEVTIVILGAVVLAGLIMIFTEKIEWLGLLIAATAFSLFSGYSIAMDGVQNAARHRIIVAWHRGLRIWLQLLLAVAAVYLVGETSTAAMVGYALSAFIVFGSQYFFFRLKILSTSRKQPATPKKTYLKILKQMRTYVWPLMAWGIFIWLRTASSRWALLTFSSTYEVGMFEVLFQLGFYPVSLGLELILQLMIPVFYEVAGNATDPDRMMRVRKLNQIVFNLTLVLTGLGVILSYWLHDWIFSLFTASEYHTVSSYLPWMILAAGLLVSSQVAAQLVVVCFQTKALLAPQVVTGILGFLFSFTSVYLWGFPGVVFAGIMIALIQFFWILKVRRDVFSLHLLRIQE